MYILKNKYQYQNVISPKKQENDFENFNQWNLFLNKYFSIEKEIIEIEFKLDRIILSFKDFWWFIKRSSISYDRIIEVLMKKYNLELIEKYDSFELLIPTKLLKNNDIENKIIIKKSEKLKIEIFLEFLEYIDFFKIEDFIIKGK